MIFLVLLLPHWSESLWHLQFFIESYRYWNLLKEKQLLFLHHKYTNEIYYDLTVVINNTLPRKPGEVCQVTFLTFHTWKLGECFEFHDQSTESRTANMTWKLKLSTCLLEMYRIRISGAKSRRVCVFFKGNWIGSGLNPSPRSRITIRVRI